MVLEARALLRCFSSLMQEHGNHNCRHIILTGNMALALYVDRGRCRNFQVLKMLREVAALVFVFNAPDSSMDPFRAELG